MDPDKQDARNSIENFIYRTAFKLRSVQTLCQMDLIDSFVIQHLLLPQDFWDPRESSLSVQQLFQALQELFQRVRVETPGHVHPRASELTLSLLTAMYDSTGTGFLKLGPAAAALIALSGDSPLSKYRALFQLYAENNRGHYESGAHMTRRTLRNLLTDLQQIPAVVGESRALCSVESAIRSCFQGVLSQAIKEKFLSWLLYEPPILLWLPTCYRLSVSEMVTHPVRCSVCRNFPITGLRYLCLKCFNFDICQVCFLSGLHSESHQKPHPVIEHCIQQSFLTWSLWMDSRWSVNPLKLYTAKENAKLLLRTLRNNLLQGRCGRKEAKRSRLLDHVNPKGLANLAHARLPIQYNSSKVPSGPVETAAKEAYKQILQRESQAQQTSDRSPHHKCADLLPFQPTQTPSLCRFFKKQLNPCKDKLQAIYASQEEKNRRFETKIHQLTTSQDSLWTKLQQMREDLQAVLQPLHPLSSSCQNRASKSNHSLAKTFWRKGDSSQIKNINEEGSEWETLPNPTMGLLPETPKFVPTEMSSPALAPAERKETTNIEERKDELEEEELQELLSKCMDAFTLEMPSGKSSVNMDLYRGAEQVSRAFSALINQITLPNLK
ncbi:LOW QUALITY PROTEIN: dystrotelin [Trichechus inunguis]